MSKRNYRQEYKDYHSKPLQKKRRAQRNAAREIMEDAGLVRKGDKKDIDHVRRNPGGNLSNSRDNLRVQPRSKNRGRNK